MKIRVIETTVKGSPVRPQSTGPGANRSPAPRTIIALVGQLGPRSAGFVLAILVALLVLTTCWAPGSPEIATPGTAGNTYSGWGCPPGKTFRWYLSQGQWKADALTAVAVLRYVLSPEPDLWTTPAATQPAPFLSAMTNSVTGIPSV